MYSIYIIYIYLKNSIHLQHNSIHLQATWAPDVPDKHHLEPATRRAKAASGLGNIVWIHMDFQLDVQMDSWICYWIHRWIQLAYSKRNATPIERDSTT